MRVLLRILVLAALAGAAAPAAAEVTLGVAVEDAQLRSLDGAPVALFEKASSASVVLFFRVAHERSLDALRAMGECQAQLAAKKVRFVGIVSDRDPPDEVRAALASAGAKLPVLIDELDALYGRMGVRTQPAIYVLDKARKIVAFETYRQVGLCDVVRARVRRALGEITEAELAQALAPAQSQLPGEDPAGVAVRHVRFGRRLLESGALDRAHDSARKSLQLAPSAAGWALEGDAFRAEGDCAKALEAYAAALRLDAAEPAANAGRLACKP